uniref:Protein E7 n=1 Tax=Human papillomavirus TaxID=10566 RepID=A0A385PLE8_9PAPI|nr:MAG: E7 protein [Human papillomavirus]
MRGNAPTISDIELELESLVLPVHLLCDESLSPDCIQEEEQNEYYQIESCCHLCLARIRLSVVAEAGAIRVLEQLLLSANLSLVCPPCAKRNVQNGRTN